MSDTPQTNKNLLPLVTASTTILAGAVVTILVYIIHTLWHMALPEEVENAILVLAEAGCAFVTHRLTTN